MGPTSVTAAGLPADASRDRGAGPHHLQRLAGRLHAACGLGVGAAVAPRGGGGSGGQGLGMGVLPSIHLWFMMFMIFMYIYIYIYRYVYYIYMHIYIYNIYIYTHICMDSGGWFYNWDYNMNYIYCRSFRGWTGTCSRGFSRKDLPQLKWRFSCHLAKGTETKMVW